MISITKENLDKKEAAVLIDKQENSNILLVSFGGVAMGLPVPVFEFMRTLDKYNINKVFIRDFQQAWYTKGIKDYSSNIDETVEYLRELIQLYGREKTIFLGNSAGGFAAVLFGALLNVKEVHAFAPQIFINWPKRLRYLDFRWTSKMIFNLNHKEYYSFDLSKRLANLSFDTEMNIYWDKSHKLDNIHVEELFYLKDKIQFLPRLGGGHNVIKELKKDGSLEQILKRASENV